MTRIILHIGPHKTGTTYIQNVLDSLRGLLLERGVYIPSIWNAAPGNPSHARLAWAIRQRNVAQIQRQIQEIIAQNYRYVVISSEDLSRLGQDEISQLRGLLGSMPTQVVYYVRRWPERLPSVWQEGVKFGRTAMFPEYLAEQLMGYDDSRWRDTATIDRFARAFDATQIKVVSYSHLVDNDLDIAGHFLRSFLDISDIKLPPFARFNQSLPIQDTEVIRALNSIHARHGGAMSPTLRNWYLTHKEGLVPDVIFDAMHNSIGNIRLDEATPPFAMASEDLLSRYGSSIVPPRHKDKLHEFRVIDVSFVRPDYLLEPIVPKLLLEIYDMCRQTLQAT